MISTMDQLESILNNRNHIKKVFSRNQWQSSLDAVDIPICFPRTLPR